MEYCFHHVPKTAGSSLQLRLAHREHIGQLPKGSTLVVYPMYNEMSFYRVSEDPGFDADKPIKEAFLRTHKNSSSDGTASIVCGHYTNIKQPGKHFLWLREPLARDVSHYNYDAKYKNTLDDNFTNHLSMMSGNFLVLWLYGKYLGKHDSVSMEHRYNTVVETLKKEKVTVYDSDKFEESWDKICAELKIDKEPRLQSNRSGKDYKKLKNISDCTDKFKLWHRSYNNYDYKLYEQFCK